MLNKSTLATVWHCRAHFHFALTWHLSLDKDKCLLIKDVNINKQNSICRSCVLQCDTIVAMCTVNAICPAQPCYSGLRQDPRADTDGRVGEAMVFY